MAATNDTDHCTGFDWAEGNLFKNWDKHHVSAAECEQIFFNKPLVTVADETHSQGEARSYALGRTDSGMLLFVVFTIRKNRIHAISARDMNQKEKKVYRKS
jgi:uncharacterized DUF497 family protein